MAYLHPGLPGHRPGLTFSVPWKILLQPDPILSLLTNYKLKESYLPQNKVERLSIVAQLAIISIKVNNLPTFL